MFISFLTSQTTEDLEQPLKFKGVNEMIVKEGKRGKGRKENIFTLQ